MFKHPVSRPPVRLADRKLGASNTKVLSLRSRTLDTLYGLAALVMAIHDDADPKT